MKDLTKTERTERLKKVRETSISHPFPLLTPSFLPPSLSPSLSFSLPPSLSFSLPPSLSLSLPPSLSLSLPLHSSLSSLSPGEVTFSSMTGSTLQAVGAQTYLETSRHLLQIMNTKYSFCKHLQVGGRVNVFVFGSRWVGEGVSGWVQGMIYPVSHRCLRRIFGSLRTNPTYGSLRLRHSYI